MVFFSVELVRKESVNELTTQRGRIGKELQAI
jgi:hypothetical protein